MAALKTGHVSHLHKQQVQSYLNKQSPDATI